MVPALMLQVPPLSEPGARLRNPGGMLDVEKLAGQRAETLTLTLTTPSVPR